MDARAALALLLLTPALAGCLAPATTPDETLGAAAGAAGALPTVTHLAGGALVADLAGLVPLSAVWRDLGHDAVEPTLGVTSSGAIFYAAAKFEEVTPGRSLPVTDVLRSRDGGLTWEDVTPKYPTGHTSPPMTGDPYVYVDPATDRIFNYDMFPILACGYLSTSDDEGQTWTTKPVGCGTPPPYDHQTIVAGKPRLLKTTPLYENVVYACVNRVTDSTCVRSLDGGLTWLAGTPSFLGVDAAHFNPTTFDGFCGGLHGHAVTAPDGTLYLPREWCHLPYVAVSRDDGTTWQQVKVADVPMSFGPDPAMAVDAAGNVYYLFVDEAGLLHLSVSRDAGATWSEPRVVSAPAVTAAHLPAIAAGDEGRIAFVYAGTENLPDGYENSDLERYDRSDEDSDVNKATWNGYLAVVTDALADEPVIQTTMVNDPADPLVRGYCGPGRCPGMYDFIDVVVGPDGRPYAAFVDACIGDCAAPGGSYKDSQGAKQGRAGAMVTLQAGPALVGEGMLAPLPAP